MAAYLYGWMGDEAVDKLLKDRQVCPMDVGTAKDLLSHMPRNLVERVGTILTDVAVSRSDAIRNVIKDLPETSDSHDLVGA